MSPVAIAILVVCAIGLICAVVLAVIAKIMAVHEDEKFPAVRGCLPGANCGACGFAGCDGYAKALIEDPATPTNLCTPGGDAVGKELSEVLGVEFTDVEEKLAMVHCLGTCGHTDPITSYEGIPSCAAAKLTYNGTGSCPFSCIGLGDCVKVCDYDAICIEDGIAHIDPRRCIGCGKCAAACPKSIIDVIPAHVATTVACSSHEKGAVTRKKCTAGCIGCKKCELQCPTKAIKVTDNLAKIDYSLCNGCGHCADVCVTGCIINIAGYKHPQTL